MYRISLELLRKYFKKIKYRFPLFLLVIGIVTDSSTNVTLSSYNFPKGIKLTSSQEFKLSLVNGEAINVFIDSPKLSEWTKGKIPTAQKAVQVIRSILKEKKINCYIIKLPSLSLKQLAMPRLV